jgi:outer membrane receptor protein involved in Fe transport
MSQDFRIPLARQQDTDDRLPAHPVNIAQGNVQLHIYLDQGLGARQVAQINASTWAISVRGFNGEYSNKLLVLLDGRSVYLPTTSGVFWDLLDVPLEDIDRIEVVRGPGGTTLSPAMAEKNSCSSFPTATRRRPTAARFWVAQSFSSAVKALPP